MVVHCAASGLQYPPLIPIWGDEAITIQPVRAGFPCLAAALIGYVEATREGDDEKNRICPPSPLSDTPTDWPLMQALGGRAALAFTAEPDIKEWADRVALNPARVPPGDAVDGDLAAVIERFSVALDPGLDGIGRARGPRSARWRIRSAMGISRFKALNESGTPGRAAARLTSEGHEFHATRGSRPLRPALGLSGRLSCSREGGVQVCDVSASTRARRI